MTVTFYSWRGTPEEGVAEPLGTVFIDKDGDVDWDESISGYIGAVLTNPHYEVRLKDGKKFLEELPRIYKNAPYLWAELT